MTSTQESVARPGRPKAAPDDPAAVVRGLGDEAIRQLLADLADHADRKMRRLSWRGVRFVCGANAPGGCGAEDVVQTAVHRYLCGDRNWNRERYPALADFLKSVIDSIVSQLVNQAENKVSSPFPQVSRQNGHVTAWDAPDPKASVLATVVDRELAARANDAIQLVLAGDEEARKVWGCITAGITKPREIAEMEDLDVKRVNNVKKRLRAKLDRVDREADAANRGPKGARP
jgi:hypothetical protein